MTPTSKVLFEKLCAQTEHERTKSNLANVWQALEHLLDVGSSDYSYKNVADTIQSLARTRGESKGSPAYSSIRNDPGECFKPLIDAFRSDHGSKDDGGRREAESLAELIPDRHTASRVRALESENRALKKRVDILKNGFRDLDFSTLAKGAPGGLAPGEQRPQIRSGEQRGGESHLLEVEEVDAIRKFLTTMDEAGLALSPAGALKLTTEGGHEMELVGPRFGQALMKLVGEF